MLACSLICLSPQHGEVEIDNGGRGIIASSIHLCPDLHHLTPPPSPWANLQAKEGANPKGEKREREINDEVMQW
jgi:hypothetical protein